MSLIKYRVREVAKDFNVPSKDIVKILTDYLTPPKSTAQVLEDHELDVIFEYMTQHNQVASLEEIFKVPTPKPVEEKKAEPKAEPAQPVKGGQQPKAAPQSAQQPQKSAAPAQQPQQPKQEKPNKPHTPRQVAEKRVVDTRGGAAVNIEKYNEKFEDMAGARGVGNNRNNNNFSGGKKEKIGGKNKQRQQAPSSKRRQEERDKMQRLQLNRPQAAAQGGDPRRNFRGRAGLPHEEDRFRGHQAADEAGRVCLRVRDHRL